MSLRQIPRWIGGLGALYLMLSPRVATRIYRGHLFRPLKYPEGNYQVESVGGVERQEVFFSSGNGSRLHAWFFKQREASGTILFHHGNAGNLSTRLPIIELLLKAGTSVFVYDYEGYGLSQGLPTVKGICDNGMAAFDYLVNEEGCYPSEILLYGESLGVSVACQVSTYRQARALILQSGFSSLRRIGGEIVPFVKLYPSWLFPKPDLDNVAILERPHPPLLIIHGDDDGVVPVEHSKELFSKAVEPKSYVLLPDAGHGDLSSTHAEGLLTAIRGFLSKLS